MSERHRRHFQQGAQTVSIDLPHDLDALLESWGQLRRKMISSVLPGFTRTEWAYLIEFADPAKLLATFVDAFGNCTADSVHAQRLLVPLRSIALWLPNNVNLLGPLTLVLLSLLGAEVRTKTGSRHRDPCADLIRWLGKECPTGPLKEWFDRSLHIAAFDRNDPRNREMAAWADVRILFGSDLAATEIEDLPHPHASVGIYFANKSSEAWIEPGMIDETSATTLAKVFAVYGQAGCTSPKRIVVVGGSASDARRLAQLWADISSKGRSEPLPRHTASETSMASQWARALGHEVIDLERNMGVAVLGPAAPVTVEANRALAFQWGSLDDVLATQAANLQTVGHCLRNPSADCWLDSVARSTAARYVVLGEMHHFGPIWDGIAWWQRLFRTTVISTGRQDAVAAAHDVAS